MTEIRRQDAVRQLRVAAFLVLLPAVAYYGRTAPTTAATPSAVFAAVLAMLGIVTAIALWQAHPICRKLFLVWAGATAVAVVYPRLPLPGDVVWSGVIALLMWGLLAVLGRQVDRGSRALRTTS